MQTLIIGLVIGAFLICALSIYVTYWDDSQFDTDEDEKLEDPEWWFGEKKNDERP